MRRSREPVLVLRWNLRAIYGGSGDYSYYYYY
jgi:hypothetical protein